MRAPAAVALALVGPSCTKVPIHDVDAGFVLADAAWFAEEETLFVFYDVRAEQGLGEPSVVELTWATDEERVDWTPISELPPVHTHLDVDCGTNAMCGSTSLHVPLEPRDVGIRLRYHRDGELALDAGRVFYVVGEGDPWSHRSFLVYGVFDERNQRVQWRGRHQFPTLRNEQAEAYGLRRFFQVQDERYGTAELASDLNPYGYGNDCPTGFTDAGLGRVETEERAIFDPVDLPLPASSASVVCADSTVTDATGTFTAGAVARKNPEVRPAFPVLRSPVRDATPIKFFLAPCQRTISAEHEAMQRQRLQMEDTETTCIDDWDTEGFADRLAALVTDAVEATRPAGDDMILLVGLHQDEDGASEVVEEALALVVPEERDTASPRLAGAFVFDSEIHGIALPELEPVTLWCPSAISTSGDYTASIACAIAPDNPEFELGPFTFGTLPILPSREQYLDFIDTYSEAQAGEVTALSFRAPEFSTTADHVDVGDYGVATFLDDEFVSTEAEDAFSYCAGDEYQLYLFRSAFMQSDEFAALVAKACAKGGYPEDFCALAELGVMPVDMLPEWHGWFGEDTYDLGIFWEFPYLLHMEYEIHLAGSVSAFGFSVPFGLAQNGESYLGSAMWTTEEFDLEQLLTQCTRFCDHPTFDSAGVYQVTDPFRTTYATSCYTPRYPEPGDSGFPIDP